MKTAENIVNQALDACFSVSVDDTDITKSTDADTILSALADHGTIYIYTNTDRCFGWVQFLHGTVHSHSSHPSMQKFVQ